MPHPNADPYPGMQYPTAGPHSGVHSHVRARLSSPNAFQGALTGLRPGLRSTWAQQVGGALQARVVTDVQGLGGGELDKGGAGLPPLCSRGRHGQAVHDSLEGGFTERMGGGGFRTHKSWKSMLESDQCRGFIN